MHGRRVVVTGLGIVSPLGNDLATNWDNLCTGRSGIGTITRFDASNQACQIAGEVTDEIVVDKVEPRHLKRMDMFIRYAIVAGSQALRDAGLAEQTGFAPERAGAIVGSGIGGLPLIEAGHASLLEAGPRRVSPFFIPSAIVNMASGWISMLYGLQGPNLAISTACTTGTHAIGEGGRKIAYGDADVMVVGGSEGTITPLAIAGFASARALSTRNDEPTQASRPFDRGRDGFVLSEGAGVLVLEEYEHAKARGANIYCELVGYGMSGDAHHITAPPDDGAGAYAAMANALQDAQVSPTAVNHINAHGTSTPLGDIAETLAIRRLFKEHADNIAVSGTKSMTGHLLGAAGGIEAVYTVLAIAKGSVPPTINVVAPDPQCDLDYVTEGTARPLEVEVALTNSFGFGGTNGTLVFAKS